MTHSVEEERSFVYDGEGNDRLDRVLLSFLEDDEALSTVTRSQLKRWIEQGAVEVNEGVVTKAGAVVKPGYEIVLAPPQDESSLTPYEFPLSIVFEDEHLIVIDKPAGIAVHPGAGRPTETLIQAVLAHLGSAKDALLSGNFGASHRPGVVHRLDLDTTGLLVVAKHVHAHAALAEQFAARSVEREYRALVLSTPRNKRVFDLEEGGTLSAALGRSQGDRRRMAVVDDGGKPAVTHWRALERFGWANLLAVKLATGRTHQIRVHFDWAGAPVIGDLTYGNFHALPKPLLASARSFGRQALHAAVLGFQHPESGEALHFESALPSDFEELIESFRAHGDAV